MAAIIPSLRVLFVTTGYPSPERPNHSVFIHRSIKALSDRLVPTVVNLRAWVPGRPFVHKRQWEGIPVVTLCCPQLPGGKWSHTNTELLSRLGKLFVTRYLRAADHVHSTDFYPVAFAASRWATIAGRSHTAHAIGSDVNVFLPHNLKKIPRDWFQSIGGVACNSKAILAQLAALLPGLPNLRVIYRGVDSDLFNPDGPEHGPQSDLPPVRFLYLGGFHTYDRQNTLYNLKGGGILMEAWQRIEASIAPSSLLITGPGTDPVQLQPWRAALRRPEAVTVLPPLAPGKIPELMRASDVVVIPSLQEGLPNVANEAQSCARPILGTDAGGIPESVLDGITGRIVPRGDGSALAEGFAWFHSHKPEIETMGIRARERMCRDFSWNRFSDQMMALFNAARGSRSCTPGIHSQAEALARPEVSNA